MSKNNYKVVEKRDFDGNVRYIKVKTRKGENGTSETVASTRARELNKYGETKSCNI